MHAITRATIRHASYFVRLVAVISIITGSVDENAYVKFHYVEIFMHMSRFIKNIVTKSER